MMIDMWRHLAILYGIFALAESVILDMTDVSTTICKDKRDGDVVSHPLDCQAYFICGTVPAIRYCDEGLHFDKLRKVCNWPEQAKCDLVSLGNNDENDRPQATSNKPQVPTVRAHPVFLAVDVDTGRPTDPLEKYDPKNVECRHFGAYFLPHPYSCRRYFICAYGHLHKHKCGRGTAWNYKRQECELDTESDCYSRNINGMDIDAGQLAIELPDEKNEQISAPSTPYETPTTTTTMASTVCFVIDTTVVTGGVTGSTESTWYPTGTYYTATQTQTTVSPVTASTGRIDSAYTDLQCPSSGEAYLPNADDCSKYFICIAGRPVPTSCPQGLFWDQNSEFCDLAKNVKCYKKQ